MKSWNSIARRLLAAVAAIGLVCAMLPASAYADSSRVVTLGADLSAEQRATVLKFFGLTEDDLSKLEVVTVNNNDERAHLADSIDSDIIGNKTFSCSYIEPTQSGGIYVRTANLTYVTNHMLYNALQTAGVKNCNLVVTAPFPVSGTGALTGVFMAYEAQGAQLDERKEEAATQELVTTAELGEEYGDAIPEVISEVKDEVVSSTQDMSDDEIRELIRKEAASRGITLSDEDLNKIIDIINGIKDLDYDPETFRSTLADFEAKLKELTQSSEEAGGILKAIEDFFKGIGDFFAGLFNGGSAPSTQDIKESAEDFFNSFDSSVFQWDSTT